MEARGAVRHPKMHVTSPRTKNFYLVQNVNSAGLDKYCFGATRDTVIKRGNRVGTKSRILFKCIRIILLLQVTEAQEIKVLNLKPENYCVKYSIYN